MKALALLLLPGCNALIGVHAFEPVDVDVDAAAEIDAPVPVSDARACFGAATGLGPFCFASVPSGNVMLSSLTIATDTCMGGHLMPTGAMGSNCVISGTTITVTGVVRAIGAYPLVLVATDSIVVTGSLDVSSHRGNPGAASGICSSGTGVSSSNGAGGGAGGSFAGAGGKGGSGKGGNGGVALAAFARPTTIRPGCDGGAAGAGSKPAAIGGPGGGAVYLAAGSSIEVSGTIAAGGAGGDRGDPTSGGGGGGGSGGLIGLDAPMIAVLTNGVVAANGGGGGGGTYSETSDAAGNDANGAAPAAGGVGISNMGGAGSGNGTTTGSDGSSGLGSVGGAGGGGAAGYILAVGMTSLAGTISPAITIP